MNIRWAIRNEQNRTYPGAHTIQKNGTFGNTTNDSDSGGGGDLIGDPILWDPSYDPDIFAYYESDSVTLNIDDTTIDVILDKSGNGRHMRPIAPSKRPTRELNYVNGQPVLTFTDTGCVTSSSFSFTDLTSVYLVRPPAGQGATARHIDHLYNVGFWQGIGPTGDSIGGGVRWTAGSPYGRFNIGAVNAWNINGLRRDATAGTDISWLNGDFAGGQSGTTSDQLATTSNPVAIGSDTGGNSFCTDTRIPCLYLFDAAISRDTRVKLEGYIAYKYGQRALLPSDHPYKSTRPYTTDVNN